MSYMKRYYEEMTDEELIQFMKDIEELDQAYQAAANYDNAQFELWLEEQDSSFNVVVEDSEDYYELRPY